MLASRAFSVSKPSNTHEVVFLAGLIGILLVLVVSFFAVEFLRSSFHPIRETQDPYSPYFIEEYA